MTMYKPPPMAELPKPPVELYLVRDLEIEPRNGRHGHTYGKLYIENLHTDHVCETHEGQDRRLEAGNTHRQSDGTALPCGRWRVTLHNCRQNGTVPMLHAVPGFQGAQMLKEYSNHLMPGAIIVGEHRHISGVSMSVLPFNRLVAYIRQKTMQGIPVFFEYIEGRIMRMLFDSILFLIVTALLMSVLTGCASIAGQAGAHPAEISCKGKGAITGQGSVPAVGGGFSIQADCGEGFTYRQSRGSE